MAHIIAHELGIEDFDERNLKSCCPFHAEDTPSFIWNKKALSFHCFGACGQNYDIIDVFMKKGSTYIEAVQKLFDLAGVKYAFGEHKAKTNHQYRYPKEEPLNDKENVYDYLETRKISKETADHLDIREDSNGNCVFNYYDTNDTLTMVKYRPARKIAHGENKNWCQKDADTCPLLYNMNRVNIDQPLLITSGELDCAAAIESGWHNAVSIPLGDQNTQWVDKNFEWLEQFKEIIICPDNDESGMKYSRDIVPRLGSWRCKIAVVPDGCKDINEVLFRHGKDAVLEMIVHAKDSPIPSVADLSDVEDMDLDKIDGVLTGIRTLDKELMRLFYGTLTIVSGQPGCVDCDTEFFNGEKWKRIADYTEGDMVLQYNPDGTATLVSPMQYHKYPCRTMYHFYSSSGVDQMLSEEHNVVYLDQRGDLQRISVAELLDDEPNREAYIGFAGRFITTFVYDGVGDIMQKYEIPTWITDAVRSPLLLGENITFHHNNKRYLDRLQLVLASIGICSEVRYGRREIHIRCGDREAKIIGSVTNGDCHIKEIQSPDGFKYCFSVPSGMLVLRRNGRINITGNSGKTSFLYQIISQALDQGRNCWLFSKELPEAMTKNWFNYILAGGHNIDEFHTDTGAVYYKVSQEAKGKINEYYKGRWFVYRDSYSNKLDDLISSMTDVVRRYNVKLLLLDNLMTIDLGANDTNELQKQTDCINKLIQFSIKYNVATILVAHPRKLMNTSDVGIYDISGTSNIVNLAHRTIGLRRITPQEKEGVMKQNGMGWHTPPCKYDVMLTVIKDRIRGRSNLACGMHYDIKSRRFFTSPEEFNFQYKWDNNTYEEDLPYPVVDDAEEAFE